MDRPAERNARIDDHEPRRFRHVGTREREEPESTGRPLLDALQHAAEHRLQAQLPAAGDVHDVFRRFHEHAPRKGREIEIRERMADVGMQLPQRQQIAPELLERQLVLSAHAAEDEGFDEVVEGQLTVRVLG